MNTLNSLKENLQKLGLKPGDTVFLRISYKAIGKVEGGPKTFLDAVVEVIGEEGTMLLTAFPKRYKNKLKYFHRKDAVDASNRPKSNTGAMSNIAMSYPNAKLSYRVDFPFVAIGKHADYLTENHTYEKTGYWILEEAIEKFDCKCLRVGGEPFIGTTHMSLSHILIEKGEYQMFPKYGLYVKDTNGIKWRETSNTTFCPSAFKKYLPEIIDYIKLGEGKIGDGYAIITNMKKSLQAEEELLRKDIKRILCDDPNCCKCRATFSFSDMSRIRYVFSQLKKCIQGDPNITIRTIKNSLKEQILFSTKNQ